MNNLKLQTIDQYTIVARIREDGTIKEFVAAYGYDDTTGTWGQGNYFTKLEYAVDFARNHKITWDRLSEIATWALHGLEDDETLEDVIEELDMDDEELEYFNLEEYAEI